MKAANISIWTNKWSDIYDFTPHKKADDGSPNFTVSSVLKNNFVTSFKEMKMTFDKISKEKGVETNSMLDIEGDD